MDEWADRWMDSRTHRFPLYFTGHCPLRVRCPKRERKIERERLREGAKEREREREKERERDSITEEGIRRCSQSPCTVMLRILMSVGFK